MTKIGTVEPVTLKKPCLFHVDFNHDFSHDFLHSGTPLLDYSQGDLELFDPGGRHSGTPLLDYSQGDLEVFDPGGRHVAPME